MFTQYFGMKFNPFSKEISVNDLYISEDIAELNARLKYLQETRGIGLVVGEADSGKSTALRRYAESLNRSTFKPCYFALSTLTVREFYQALAMILGETPSYKKVTLFHQIQRAITELYYSQKITPVIILDEIQLVSNDVLEDLRIIFNFNMDSQNPYILILSGQPHIRNKLALNVNSALRQRISIKYVMQGLKKEEIQDYIKTRMKIAGMVDDIFTPSAYEAIYSLTKGLPRIINNLVTASLLYAYSKRLREIDEEVIYQAQNEISL
ncbi:ATPase AAA [Thermoanaerobacter sp. YS13]|uniref:ExeA family protein n=1 Tax=Thermoanaerobacter sp. YS13 TaxID=1511746 RepID=UPI000573323B|nr:AAA family ATPase [Thermoanaerobacter sp. YS13]KHO61711.1 ATPase AAA [Thermoanaerobacter sp. YS13]